MPSRSVPVVPRRLHAFPIWCSKQCSDLLRAFKRELRRGGTASLIYCVRYQDPRPGVQAPWGGFQKPAKALGDPDCDGFQSCISPCQEGEVFGAHSCSIRENTYCELGSSLQSRLAPRDGSGGRIGTLRVCGSVKSRQGYLREGLGECVFQTFGGVLSSKGGGVLGPRLQEQGPTPVHPATMQN